MQPIDFPEANRTFTKPEGTTDDECQPLRVCDTGDALVSHWLPDADERARLAAGSPVALMVFGRGHPMVRLEVRDGPVEGATPGPSETELLRARVAELEEALASRAKRVELRPGDVAVLEAPRHLSPAECQRIKEAWERAFLGCPMPVILDGGLTLAAVLGPKDAARERGDT